MARSSGFTSKEVESIYVSKDDRFVVALIVGYGGADDVTTPQEAAHYALDLTRDEGSSDTRWYVYDRETKTMHDFEQSDIEDLPEESDDTRAEDQ